MAAAMERRRQRRKGGREGEGTGMDGKGVADGT